MIFIMVQMIRLLSTILHHYEGVSGDERAIMVKPDLQEERHEIGIVGLESCKYINMYYMYMYVRIMGT